MSFLYPIVLVFVPLSLLLIYFIKKYNFDEKKFSKRVLDRIAPKKIEKLSNIKQIFLILSIAFAILALSRPYIKGKEIKVDSRSYEIVVGFDISNSMLCDDVYPNRLEFAKQKFYNFLNDLKDEKVAILGFSSRAFLIAPPTDDYESLRFLVKNMQTDYISLKGTDIEEFLKSANELFSDKNAKKAVVIFSDGGDKKSYKKEIEYAKKHNMKVFIYAIGTKKGGVIKTKNGVLKDKKGDIVVVKLNENIKELALKSGGAYLKYSLKNNDIKELVDVIRKSFESESKNSIKTIKNNLELFWVALIFSILFFFLSSFSIQRSKS
jgi:Ca-activated chloride channel family protein